MSADQENSRLIQAHTVRWLVLLLGVPVTYAILRYHIFGPVEWAHFPLYIANKALSLAAVFFIATSYLIGKTLGGLTKEMIRWRRSNLLPATGCPSSTFFLPCL